MRPSRSLSFGEAEEECVYKPKDLLKRPEFFIYPDETNENQIYPSSEDSEDVEIKEKLIKKYVQEHKNVEFDGRIICRILGEPKAFNQEIEQEKKAAQNKQQPHYAVNMNNERMASLTGSMASYHPRGHSMVVPQKYQLPGSHLNL